MPCDYELVILGGGAAELTAAGLGAQLGARTLPVEKERILPGTIRSRRKATTSAQSFRGWGPLKQQLHNGWLLHHDRHGADPEMLVRAYARGQWRIARGAIGDSPSV